MTMPTFDTWWQASLADGVEIITQNVTRTTKQLLRAAYEQGFVDGQYKVEQDGPAPDGMFHISKSVDDKS